MPLSSASGEAMRRRAVIKLVGGVAATWPFAALAQQSERMRRIGVLMHTAADDAEGQTRLAAFLQGLQETGWAVGRNVHIDTRWASANADRFRSQAVDLLALTPDVIFASTSQSVAALQKATSTVPIVFAGATDPVAQGFVDSIARPGGNITGFSVVPEFSISAKWLELMKQIAPGVTRVAVIRDTAAQTALGQFSAIQAMAQSLGVEVQAMGMRDASEIERAIAAFASRPNSGLILTLSPQAFVHRALIIALAARHRLPAVYPLRIFVADGGLVSYGSNAADAYRGAATYVDRILKGEKPANLPVQSPTKFELVINLKTAKALGLTLPPTLLASANEVIE
jgi:putative tryptophan/tyrosine transport system substrate-binding protein